MRGSIFARTLLLVCFGLGAASPASPSQELDPLLGAIKVAIEHEVIKSDSLVAGTIVITRDFSSEQLKNLRWNFLAEQLSSHEEKLATARPCEGQVPNRRCWLVPPADVVVAIRGAELGGTNTERTASVRILMWHRARDDDADQPYVNTSWATVELSLVEGQWVVTRVHEIGAS